MPLVDVIFLHIIQRIVASTDTMVISIRIESTKLLEMFDSAFKFLRLKS